MGDLADDISFIHLDFACFGNQGKVTFYKYSSGKDDGEYFLATARPIVPAIFRTSFMRGQNVPTRTFCFLTFFIFKYCTMEYVFVIGRVIGTNNSRNVNCEIGQHLGGDLTNSGAIRSEHHQGSRRGANG